MWLQDGVLARATLLRYGKYRGNIELASRPVQSASTVIVTVRGGRCWFQRYMLEVMGQGLSGPRTCVVLALPR